MFVVPFGIFVKDEPNPVDSPTSQGNQAAEFEPAEEASRLHLPPSGPELAVPPSEPHPLWRLFLYGVLAAALYLLLTIVMSVLRQRIEGSIRLGLIAEVGLLLTATAPALVLSRLERRPWGDYGLPRAGFLGKLFWSGAGWGLAAISLLMLVLYLTGTYEIERLSLHGVRILKFAAFWSGFFLVVALFEEFLMRGYSQFTLAKAIGFWPSAVLLSGGFAAIHLDNPGETAPGIAAVGVIGLFFCLTLRRTGNLWFAVGFHASWDWGESFLYSVPDSGGTPPGHLLKCHLHDPAWLSGGSAGPEGSVLLFLLVVLLWFVFSRVYRDVKYRNS